MHNKRVYVIVGATVLGLLVCAAIVLSVIATQTHAFGALSSDDNGDGGKVSVKFVHTTAKRNIAPSYFGMKLIAVYLSHDKDNNTGSNIGNTAMIYQNPDCHDDLRNCGIQIKSDKYYRIVNRNWTVINTILRQAYDPDISGTTYGPTTFFDFSLPGDEVNAALNAQELTIAAGDYHYVRVEFCKGNPDQVANIAFQAGDMSSPHEYAQNGCVVDSDRVDPPIRVSSNSTVTVQLSYSLDDTINVANGAVSNPYPNQATTANYTYPFSNDHDYTADQRRYSFSMPMFVPSAIVAEA